MAHTQTNQQRPPESQKVSAPVAEGTAEQVTLGRCSHQVVPSLWLDWHLLHLLHSGLGVGDVNHLASGGLD